MRKRYYFPQLLYVYFNKNGTFTKVAEEYNNLAKNPSLFSSLYRNVCYLSIPRNNTFNYLEEILEHNFKVDLIVDKLPIRNILIADLLNHNINEGYIKITKYGIDVIEYNNEIFNKRQELANKKNKRTIVDRIKKRKKVVINAIDHLNLITEQEPLQGVLYNLDLKNSKQNIEWLKQVESKIQSIENIEYLFDTLQQLEKIIENTINKIIVQTSLMQITEDYKINFEFTSKLEIKLNALTKAIYILFCKYPEGINIEELSNYEDELLKLYKCISPKSNLDEIISSVKRVCDLKTKEIYVHISRVKQAFSKHHNGFFVNYTIQSLHHGNHIKYIPAVKDK